MNEKFNKNSKLEKFTNILGIAVRLIVIDPYETKGKPRKKMPHPGIEPELCEKQKLGVHGAEQLNADTSRPHCRQYQKCYNLYSTSEPDKLVVSKQRQEFL